VKVAHEEIVAELLEDARGLGADYTFEATGIVSVMAQAVETARFGWGLCTIAGVAGKGETLDIVPRWLMQGRRVQAASFGGVRGRDQVPELVERYLAGDIDADALVSRRLRLDDVNEAFDLMHAQDGIRSVITFG
jgi:S-(hydroxymethyl)glutathione dehydrogenase/alcohol dehydrogenase